MKRAQGGGAVAGNEPSNNVEQIPAIAELAQDTRLEKGEAFVFPENQRIKGLKASLEKHQDELRKYEGLGGFFKGMVDGGAVRQRLESEQADIRARLEVEYGNDAKARAKVVSEWIQSRERAPKKEHEKMYEIWKTLGNWNAEAVFKGVTKHVPGSEKAAKAFEKHFPWTGKLLRVAGKALSVRTVLAGAAVMGSAAFGAAALGAGIGAGVGYVTARALGMFGGGVGGHDLFNAIGKGRLEKNLADLPDLDVNALSVDQIEAKLQQLEAKAVLYGKDISDNEGYTQLLEQHEALAKAEQEKRLETTLSAIELMEVTLDASIHEKTARFKGLQTGVRDGTLARSCATAAGAIAGGAAGALARQGVDWYQHSLLGSITRDTVQGTMHDLGDMGGRVVHAVDRFITPDANAQTLATGSPTPFANPSLAHSAAGWSIPKAALHPESPPPASASVPPATDSIPLRPPGTPSVTPEATHSPAASVSATPEATHSIDLTSAASKSPEATMSAIPTPPAVSGTGYVPSSSMGGASFRGLNPEAVLHPGSNIIETPNLGKVVYGGKISSFYDDPRDIIQILKGEAATLEDAVLRLGRTLSEYIDFKKNWQDELDVVGEKVRLVAADLAAPGGRPMHPFKLEDWEHLRNMASWRGTDLGEKAHGIMESVTHTSGAKGLLEQSGIYSLKLEGGHQNLYTTIQEAMKQHPEFFRGQTADDVMKKTLEHYHMEFRTLDRDLVGHPGETIWFSRDGVLVGQMTERIQIVEEGGFDTAAAAAVGGKAVYGPPIEAMSDEPRPLADHPVGPAKANIHDHSGTRVKTVEHHDQLDQEAPPKRPRGRPRKVDVMNDDLRTQAHAPEKTVKAPAGKGDVYGPPASGEELASPSMRIEPSVDYGPPIVETADGYLKAFQSIKGVSDPTFEHLVERGAMNKQEMLKFLIRDTPLDVDTPLDKHALADALNVSDTTVAEANLRNILYGVQHAKPMILRFEDGREMAYPYEPFSKPLDLRPSAATVRGWKGDTYAAYYKVLEQTGMQRAYVEKTLVLAAQENPDAFRVFLAKHVPQNFFDTRENGNRVIGGRWEMVKDALKAASAKENAHEFIRYAYEREHFKSVMPEPPVITLSDKKIIFDPAQ